jgi:hypothetical protein
MTFPQVGHFARGIPLLQKTTLDPSSLCSGCPSPADQRRAILAPRTLPVKHFLEQRCSRPRSSLRHLPRRPRASRRVGARGGRRGERRTAEPGRLLILTLAILQGWGERAAGGKPTLTSWVKRGAGW